jgi:hypothetical protein
LEGGVVDATIVADELAFVYTRYEHTPSQAVVVSAPVTSA